MHNPLSVFIDFLKQRLGAAREDFAQAEQHLSDAIRAEVSAAEQRLRDDVTKLVDERLRAAGLLPASDLG